MNSISTVILELGSHVLRCGVAGEVAPRVAMPWVPEELTSLSAPRAREAALRLLYDLIFSKLTFRPRDCRVVIVEALTAPAALRQLISSVLLRDLSVVSVSLQPDVCMAALASGCSNGIVLDIGHTETRAVAFADGYLVLHSLAVSPTGVSAGYKDLHNRLGAIAGEAAGPTVEVATKIFQRTARTNPPVEVSVPYISGPDGAPVTVPGELIVKSLHAVTRGEVYCSDGGIDKDEMGGAAGALLQCLKNCSPDVRARVSRNVVVCGGGGCIPGIIAMVLDDARSLASSEPDYQPLLSQVAGESTTPSNCSSSGSSSRGIGAAPVAFLPSNLAWVGGSLFASLQANESKFVKLDDMQFSASGSSNSSSDLRLPDWLSLDTKDWLFFAPTNVINA